MLLRNVILFAIIREINCGLIYSFNSNSYGVVDISIKVNHSNSFKGIIDFKKDHRALLIN